MQSRTAALRSVARWGLLWGLGATLAGTALGYLYAGHTRAAALNGLDFASLALFVLAGGLVIGQSQGFRSDQVNRLRFPGTASMPRLTFTWGSVLILLLGGAVCSLLDWALTHLGR